MAEVRTDIHNINSITSRIDHRLIGSSVASIFT